MQPTPSAVGDSHPLAEREGLDPRSPSLRWLGAEWSRARRSAIVLGVALVYVLLFVSLARTGGRIGAAPLSTIVVALAGALLGLPGGLIAAAAALPLHTLLLNLAGQTGWDVAIRDGGWPGSVALFLVGGLIGFLRDLALRIDAQAREIAAQRRRLADEVASRSDVEAVGRASETRFRAVFDGAGVGVAVTSLTGEVQESNAVLQQMLGHDAQHLRGRLLPDLVAPADAPTLRAAFDALARDGGSRQRAEVRVVGADGATLATALTATAVHDGAGAARFAIVVVEDTTERVRQQSRRAALLRVARRLAASPDRDAVLADLLGEAELLLGADGANVFRWDEARGELIVVMSSLEEAARTGPIRAGEGAVGRAVAERAAVVIADYQSDPAAIAVVREAGVRAVAAVPLMEEGRVLGALSVARTKPGRGFDADDVEVLELLAEAAAAALVGLERARLDGVMLAARTAEHELNNRLAPTVGYAELLASDPALPPDLRALAMLTMRGARDAARIVQQLRLVTRLEETDWGPNVNTTIDITRSLERPSDAVEG